MTKTELELVVIRNHHGRYAFDRESRVVHRDGGPAIVLRNGAKFWFIKGQRHREDGPAIEGLYGYKAWYNKGKRHRVDGPAVIDGYGELRWYLKGVQKTKEEFEEFVAKQ